MSCTKEEGVNPPAGEKAINEIVTALEDKEEISDFVEILKKVDVANLTEDKLTVFAVRNSSSATRSTAVLDSVSIKRHIAKESYAKADLTDGKELESINGEKLYITRNGDEIYVNGVIIEGEAIPAGSSYVYIVPEVLEEKTEAETYYTTTINVRKLTWGQAQDEPFEGVNVVVSEAGEDILGIWTEGEFIGEWKTDANGQVIVKHTANEIVFWVYKDGYTDRYEGYMFEGVDADGKFRFYDTNADGLINNYDKFFNIMRYYVNNEDGQLDTVYMVDINDDTIELPLPEASSVNELWKYHINNYMTDNFYLESRLTNDEWEFNYNKDLIETSDEFWSSSYQTLDWGASCVKSLEIAGGYSDLVDKIEVDMCLIKTQLFGYYNTLVGYYDRIEIEETIADINRLIDTVNADDERCALHLMLAKLYLLVSNYEESMSNSDKVIEKGFYNLNDKETIWGGYDNRLTEENDIINPLKYSEILLLKSCACLMSGNLESGLNSFNSLRSALGLEVVSSYSSSDLMDMAKDILQGTGQLYPYARILDGSFNVSGFDTNKNRLLPIPLRALETYPTLKQNEGYY